jgi:hypothetical protein
MFPARNQCVPAGSWHYAASQFHVARLISNDKRVARIESKITSGTLDHSGLRLPAIAALFGQMRAVVDRIERNIGVA